MNLDKNVPQDSEKVSPTIRMALGISVLFYAVFLVAQVTVMGLDAFGLRLRQAEQFLGVQSVAWLVTLLVAARVARAPWNHSYPLKPIKGSLLLPVVLASVGAAVVLSEVTAWIPMPDSVRDAFEDLLGERDVVTVLALIVVAPVAEELFFRGWMLRGFLGNYSARKAVLVSALIFAVFHLNPWQAVSAFPLGIGFAWLVIRTGSLVPVILAHAAANSTEYVFEPFFKMMGYSEEAIDQLTHIPWQMLVSGVVLLAAGGYWLYRTLPGAGDPGGPTSIPPNEGMNR